MSIADPPLATESPPSAALERPRSTPSTKAMVARVVLVVLLIVGSGGLRLWQQRQVEASLVAGLVAPYPLEDLPLQLGDWHGQPDELDPQIARRTGSTDHVYRTYTNQKTGVRLAVIVLYGPAADLRLHAPEICYPTAGYAPIGGARQLELPVDAEETALIRTLVYGRGEGGQTERQEVYYSWYFNGRWTPETGVQKQIERVPAMFKVHVARPLADRELRGGTANPCQDFLEELLPVMKQRLAAAQARDA